MRIFLVFYRHIWLLAKMYLFILLCVIYYQNFLSKIEVDKSYDLKNNNDNAEGNNEELYEDESYGYEDEELEVSNLSIIREDISMNVVAPINKIMIVSCSKSNNVTTAYDSLSLFLTNEIYEYISYKN